MIGMRLHYIGKSNKQYTYNKVYHFSGDFAFDYDWMRITITDNKNIKHFYNTDHAQYFVDNFNVLNDEQYKQLMRKIKLKKIGKI